MNDDSVDSEDLPPHLAAVLVMWSIAFNTTLRSVNTSRTHVGPLTISNKDFWVLCCGEVSKSLHSGMLAAGDLIAGGLAHCGGVAPVVFACQHVHWALL